METLQQFKQKINQIQYENFQMNSKVQRVSHYY